MIAVAIGEGEPAAQISYYPYGVVKTAAIFDYTIGPVRMDHQDLFFDRFDVPWDGQRMTAASASGNLGWLDTTPAALTGRGRYQNRNRSYDPGLGRFVQRDPNASGVVTTSANPTLNMVRSVAPVSLLQLYTDGASAHAYVICNPVNANDPSGLFLVTTDILASTSTRAGMHNRNVHGVALAVAIVADVAVQLREMARRIGPDSAPDDPDEPKSDRFAVRVQAQGGRPELQKSVVVDKRQPITTAKGLRALDDLARKLSKKEHKERIDCFRCAERFIMNAPAGGGIGPPTKKTVLCRAR